MGGPDRQPDWLDPELATLTRERFSDPAWIYERKLDGERCLTFRDGADLRLETRNRKVVSSTYPELAEALAGQSASDFIVDGEVVAFEDGQTRFSQLQQRLGVAHPGPELLQQGAGDLLHLRCAVGGRHRPAPAAAAGTQAAPARACCGGAAR